MSPCPPARKAGIPAWPANQPTVPATSTISGNGTRNAKIATKAASARTRSVRCPSARRAIRASACSTIASTAAFRPKKMPVTISVGPKAT